MLRFACLQSCVPKDIYKAFAWINGGRLEGQHSGGAVQSCEREPWEHSAGLAQAEILEPRGSVPVSSHSLCSSACLRGGIRKPLPHFGAEYHLLSAVFSLFKVGTPLSAPVMIFVSCWIANWDLQLAPGALASETTRSLKLNKYELSCSSSSITSSVCNCFYLSLWITLWTLQGREVSHEGGHHTSLCTYSHGAPLEADLCTLVPQHQPQTKGLSLCTDPSTYCGSCLAPNLGSVPNASPQPCNGALFTRGSAVLQLRGTETINTTFALFKWN